MRKEIREEIEPMAKELHKHNWHPDERDAIRDEFFLTEEEADGVVEILAELEKEKR